MVKGSEETIHDFLCLCHSLCSDLSRIQAEVSRQSDIIFATFVAFANQFYRHFLCVRTNRISRRLFHFNAARSTKPHLFFWVIFKVLDNFEWFQCTLEINLWNLPMCERLHVCVYVSRLSACVCDTFCALSKRLKNNYTFDINGACSWRRQQEQQIKQPQQIQQLQKQPQQQLQQ